MKEYWKGDLVWKKKDIAQQGLAWNRQWVIINNEIFDFTNYFYTAKQRNNLPEYLFMGDKLGNIVRKNPGADVTDLWNKQLNNTEKADYMSCMKNVFYLGRLFLCFAV